MQKQTKCGKVTVDGIGLYWEKVGRGRHVVLCIAGVLGDICSDLRPLWEEMDKDTFTLVGIDAPGYGFSRPPDRDYCIEECIYQRDARLLGKLMEKLGHKRFSVIGHSGGGVVGIMMAGLYPEKVRKVVACNAPFAIDTFLLQTSKQMVNLDNWPADKKHYIEKTYGKEYGETVLKSWAKCLADEFDTGNNFMILKELCGRITETPVLYIRGTGDLLLSPDTALKFQKCVPHMRIHEVPGGHHSHLTFLNTFVNTAEDFLLG